MTTKLELELLALRRENARLRKQVEEAEALLKDAVFCIDPEDRTDMVAPEDTAVLPLCQRHGFGAVMDSASRQWFKQVGSGAFTVGTCYAIADSWMSRYNAYRATASDEDS